MSTFLSPSRNPVLVEWCRGHDVESLHAGALAIVDGDGGCVLAIGDIDRPVFPRSAVKLLQALPLVESGSADRLGLDDAALALACASHNGEAAHARTAASMLQAASADASWLECGAHWPMLDTAARELAARGESPSALHNNCSGKHAGFVCLACGLAHEAGRPAQAFATGYVAADHPVMREVAAAVGQVTGGDLARAPRGIDGCSIPTWAQPLRQLAHGYARVATGHGLPPVRAAAAARLRRAIAAAPFMVGGSGRFDTRVMERLGERACVKVGAEGVYCAALPGRGLGVALKIDDGTTARAAEVVMAAVLEALLPLDDEASVLLRSLSEPRLRNWRGLEVASARPTAALRQALAAAV